MTPSIVVEARKPDFPSHKDQNLASILLYFRIGSIRRSAREADPQGATLDDLQAQMAQFKAPSSACLAVEAQIKEACPRLVWFRVTCRPERANTGHRLKVCRAGTSVAFTRSMREQSAKDIRRVCAVPATPGASLFWPTSVKLSHSTSIIGRSFRSPNNRSKTSCRRFPCASSNSWSWSGRVSAGRERCQISSTYCLAEAASASVPPKNSRTSTNCSSFLSVRSAISQVRLRNLKRTDQRPLRHVILAI